MSQYTVHHRLRLQHEAHLSGLTPSVKGEMLEGERKDWPTN